MKCAFTKAESAWVIEFKLGDRSDEKKNISNRPNCRKKFTVNLSAVDWECHVTSVRVQAQQYFKIAVAGFSSFVEA